MSETTPFESIIRVGDFEDFIEPFQTIVSEATLNITPDGIEAEPVDPARVAMVTQSLDAAAFESYDTGGINLGLNLDTLMDYVGAGDSDDLLHLRLNNETRHLEIDVSEAHFEMACIDPDSIRDGQEVDDDVFAREEIVADVKLDAAAFSHATNVIDMVSDHVVYDCDEDRPTPIHVIGEGDTDNASVEFDSSLHEGSEVFGVGESMFNLEYLDDMCKVIPDDATIRVRIGDSHPIRIDYDHINDRAEVAMCIAPRISSM